MENTIIRTEHGWLTIRTETGWLLWGTKLTGLEGKGQDFGVTLKQMEKAFAEWQRERSMDEEEDKAASTANTRSKLGI